MYRSEDLGGHQILAQVIFNYEQDAAQLLILSDDHADGLVHIYYGPSLKEALTSLQEVLADDFDTVKPELLDFIRGKNIAP